jgi:hypothetical protein
MTRFLWCAVALLGQPSLLAGSPQTSPLPDPTPVEPVTALVQAFRTHDLVALQEPHGNEQVQALLLALIRDPVADGCQGHRVGVGERTLSGRAGPLRAR